MKKSLLVDVFSVKEIDDDLLKKYFNDKVILSFISESDIEDFKNAKLYTKEYNTNLGIFRKWIYFYLKNRGDVTLSPYVIVHNLPSQGAGLPVELIFFINTTIWVNYEEIQSEIFEQILSLMDRFDLNHFQFEQWAYSTQNTLLKED